MEVLNREEVGSKWVTEKAVEEAESRLEHKNIIVALQVSCQGLGWTRHTW